MNGDMNNPLFKIKTDPATTPPQTTATAEVITLPTTPPKPKFCERLSHTHEYDSINLSTHSQSIGTSVNISCNGGFHLMGPKVMYCRANGMWEPELVPKCFPDSSFGITAYWQLMIGLFAGCGALVLVCLTVILLRCCFRSMDNDKGSNMARSPTESTTSLAYIADNKRYRETIVKREVHQEPVVYSSFLNPAFSTEYDKWRQTATVETDTRSEVLYDCPWQHTNGAVQQTNSSGPKWSRPSISAHDNFNYEKYGTIPRVSITSTITSIQDQSDFGDLDDIDDDDMSDRLSDRTAAVSDIFSERTAF